MRWQFVLGQTLTGLRRNFAMAIAIAIVTLVSLTFVGAGALLQFQVSKIKTYFYGQVEVAVFMCPQERSNVANCAAGPVNEDQLKNVERILQSPELKSYVKSWEKETPQQAYDNLRRITKQAWVEHVKPEQMQYSFRVSLQDPQQYQVIADELSGVAGVQTVIDQREVFEQLFSTLNKLTLLALGFGLIMVVAAILLIATTIKLSAILRRKETEIMRLVGASNSFVHMPFLLEVAISALVGAGLAIGALWAGVKYILEGWFASASSPVNFVDTSDVWLISPLLILIALGLAVVSSLVTLGKYTKV